jgi:hypothetical protein
MSVYVPIVRDVGRMYSTEIEQYKLAPQQYSDQVMVALPWLSRDEPAA